MISHRFEKCRTQHSLPIFSVGFGVATALALPGLKCRRNRAPPSSSAASRPHAENEMKLDPASKSLGSTGILGVIRAISYILGDAGRSSTA
jgi:hypothetical protein